MYLPQVEIYREISSRTRASSSEVVPAGANMQQVDEDPFMCPGFGELPAGGKMQELDQVLFNYPEFDSLLDLCLGEDCLKTIDPDVLLGDPWFNCEEELTCSDIPMPTELPSPDSNQQAQEDKLTGEINNRRKRTRASRSKQCTNENTPSGPKRQRTTGRPKPKERQAEPVISQRSEPSPAEGASLPTTPQRIFHLPPSIQFITIPETTGYKVVQTLRLSPPVIGLPLPNSAASPTYIFVPAPSPSCKRQMPPLSPVDGAVVPVQASSSPPGSLSDTASKAMSPPLCTSPVSPSNVMSACKESPLPQSPTVPDIPQAVKDYIQEAKARMCQDLEANLSLTSHHVDVQVSQRDIVRTAKPTNKVLDKELVIMGDTDRQKSLLRPSQIFEGSNGDKLKRYILLLGNAGMGKTTLIRKLCLDWSRDCIPQFDFVFLLDGKALTLTESTFSLQSLLLNVSSFVPPCLDPEAVFAQILAAPKRVLIIFDGFDELRDYESLLQTQEKDLTTSLQRDSKAQTYTVRQLYSAILQRILLPGCTLLLSTRPKGTASQLLRRTDSFLEMCGFTPTDIETYLSQYVTDPALRASALDCLKNCSYLHLLCWNPGLCQLVCWLLQESKGLEVLPRTLTGLCHQVLRLKMEMDSKTTHSEAEPQTEIPVQSEEETQTQISSSSKVKRCQRNTRTKSRAQVHTRPQRARRTKKQEKEEDELDQEEMESGSEEVDRTQQRELLSQLSSLAWECVKANSSILPTGRLTSTKLKEFGYRTGLFTSYHLRRQVVSSGETKGGGRGDKEDIRREVKEDSGNAYAGDDNIMLWANPFLQSYLAGVHLSLSRTVSDRTFLQTLPFQSGPKARRRPQREELELTQQFAVGLLFHDRRELKRLHSHTVTAFRDMVVGKQTLVTKHLEGLLYGDLSPAQVLEACHYVYEASSTHGDGSRGSGSTELVGHLASNLPEVLTFRGVPLNPADVFAVQNVLERGGTEGRSFCLDLEDSGIQISGLRALVGLNNLNTYRACIADVISLWEQLEQGDDEGLRQRAVSKLKIHPLKATQMCHIEHLAKLVNIHTQKYRKSPQGKCASVCSARDCDVNAQCSSQGAKVSCVCKAGYEGDGRICVPKNPCSENNGGCPVNSTICVFKGPNKSSCECMSGMTPVAGSAEFGCHLVSACSADTCDPTAVCRTELDGHPRCVCDAGQIGDGHRCYGNLMERLIELDRSGSQRENLTGAVALFEKGCSLLLSHNGPFTAFIPLLKTPLTGVNEELVCKNHLILGQHLYKNLEGRDFNLYGGATLRSKDNKRFILMDDPSRQYQIIQEDLPAANGIIHIIDRPITNTLSDRPSRDEQFADKTIGEILTKDGKYNRFLSLVDNSGSPPPLRGPGPLTVFVPTNEAVDRARDGSILYMLNDAKYKLQELLRHHVFSQAVLTVDELATVRQIRTLANQVVTISVSDSGEILLGEKGIHLTTTNIMASNGIIHMIDGLLYPPSILPILPHRCDVTESKITMGPCVHCSYLYETDCPEGTTELNSHQTGCEYVTSPLRPTLSRGCAKFCNATRQIAECCKGFYGPDCKPCIGGFQHPCYDKGTCFDGIHGNGSCSCQSGFKGVACHICSDPSKHGDKCDEDCRCLHGVCDNRPGSRGVCRRGSCIEGYSGENCDRTATPCNSDGLQEHCHIHAYCTHTGLNTKCVCRDGYDGDGHSCSPINPCLKSNRGDCDTNAQCVYAGPGNASCVCSEGWTGDGRVCVEINNCQLQSRGGCSPNADCNHRGPGQSECVCKTGYAGDGIVCDLLNPCLFKNGGCHGLAKCEQKEGETHTCTCPDGYAGDGHICYGTLLDELDMNPELYLFHRLTEKYSHLSLDLSGNFTLLVPTSKAMRNVTSDRFWISRHNLPHFLRAHILPGIYSVEDLDKLVGSKQPTLNPPTFWEISNSSGVISVGNASIIKHNLPAINGYIHVIDKLLTPSRSELPPMPPTLMAFLNSSTNFTLFKQYALMYNLTKVLNQADFTLLLPTDEAIRQHLSRTNSSVLDSDVLKYHVILRELLFPDHLSDGKLKSTMLGEDYQVQFHIDNKNQTVVNGVPLDGTFTETEYGIIMVLPQVLKIQRNRCSKHVTVQVNGRCADCDGPPRCLFDYKPIKAQFPANMRSNCRYRKRVGSRRKLVPGCVIKCLRVLTDNSCCPGYYGHECFKCPGDVGSWCSNHGQCQDGNEGNGECRCFEGFHGTACEDCEPGRYGVNCSSKCVCDHGKCEDGLAGSGKCVCYKGWKGASCSVEIKDDACGGVCDENANCITGPKGTAPACVCVAGYEGNGTYCKELDLCSRSNGGCSEFAVCTKVSAGERTCTCKAGYTGDGVVCLEIDGCLVNNGGCHKSADCIRIGANITGCRCQTGFQGSGLFCYPVNPCRNNNGGCSRYARCEYMGQGQRNCTCLRGHVGDGFSCRGTTNNEVFRNPENAFFTRMLSASDSRNLYGDGPFTVFVPAEETNNDSSYGEWRSAGRLSDLVRYHVVSCEILTLSDLKTTKLAVATSGHTLHFSLQEGSVWVNNRSRIVRSDYTTTNGVIHHVDKLLTPYKLQDKPVVEPNLMNLTSAAVFYGYNRFYKLIEDAGLIPVLKESIHQPFTMFWPTDQALSSLPAERQRWLSSPDHQDQLAAIVKAHIIRNSKILSISQPHAFSSFRTMHGSTIKYSCDKNVVGAVLINTNAARVEERFLAFKEGIAYGIDQLLEPPGLGAHCDTLENKTTYGRCGTCYNPPSCPFRHQNTGKTESCLNYRSRHGMGYSWYHDLDDPFSRRGCKKVCVFASWVQKCCKNHYSRDCQVCPGGLESPCSNHGNCDDGLTGSGRCRCYDGFKGRACELCLSGHYGPNCTACSCGRQGRCDEGIEGSGQCTCNPGWAGDQCQKEIGSIPEECRQCHTQADCVPGVGCQCKPGFQGNGTDCSPEPPPDLCLEYNGGCHQNADCNQTGLLVNCTCQSGYQGDGFSCDPINRCIEEQNGGCSDLATCKFTGPNVRRCECLTGYVGNGVQCLERLVSPVDRCLEANGGCDPVATCTDRHFFDKTAGVFHLRSPEGKYKMNFSQADAACQAEGATLVNFKQLGDAQQMGMHLCVAGWMEGGKVGYPIRFPSVRCGDNHVGLVMYKEPVDQSSKYDAYCYRLKDVSCVCPAGYIGNGDFCNGVLTNVLATYSNFSIFYKFLLDYSGSSSEGEQLVEFLSHRTSGVTLFVPHNSGFTQNKTLSGRDLEYHISANHSIRSFKDLKHQEVIISRLGFNLTVTHGKNESLKLVNKRQLVDWDIPAVNGIIHVIEAPLTAPPAPISHHASRSHAHSSGTVSAVLVSMLLVCVLAALGYYVFKHKTDAFRFQYFRNEDEDGATSGSKKPTLVSIPNPLYSGSRAFTEPFGEANQELDPAEPEESPNIINLD